MPPSNQQPPVQSKKSNKRGSIEKCPACGAEVKSMSLNCEECGHEYTNVKSFNGLEDLKKKLEEIHKDAIKLSNDKSNLKNQLESSKTNNPNGYLSLSLQNQGVYIRTYSFHNTKEELIEHLTYSLAQIKSLNLEIDDISARIGTDFENEQDKQLYSSFNFLVNSWESMLEQCISKAKLFISDKEELEKILSITKDHNITNSKNDSKKEFYPSGNKKSEGEFKVSIIDGLKREIPIGLHKSWYQNGNIKEERIFDNKGILNGIQKEWHENGVLKREFYCKDGLFEGMSKAWYSNGQLFGEVYYKDNYRHGPSRNWYNDGQIKLKKVFINKKLNGLVTSWHKNGEIMILEHYQDNEQIHGKYYNINGEETSPDHVRSTFEKILQSINTIT